HLLPLSFSHFIMLRPHPPPTLFPYTTLFRSAAITLDINLPDIDGWRVLARLKDDPMTRHIPVQIITTDEETERGLRMGAIGALTDRKSTRLNSSHSQISYAVFCLKKKRKRQD